MRVAWLVLFMAMVPALLCVPLRLGLWIRARWAVRHALAGLTVYHAAFYRRGIGECLDLAAARLVRCGLLHVSREGALTVAAPGAATALEAPDEPAAALLELLRAHSASPDGELRLHQIKISNPPAFREAVKFVTDMMLVLAHLTSGPVHIGLWTLLALLAASIAAPMAAADLERRVIRTSRLPKQVPARRCQEVLDAHTRTHHDPELAKALMLSGHAPIVGRSAASDPVGGPAAIGAVWAVERTAEAQAADPTAVSRPCPSTWPPAADNTAVAR